MALRPPSLSKIYDEYYTGDPAFVQLPDDATAEQRKAYENQWRVARETGDYAALIVPGKMPTGFRMRVIPGELFRFTLDRSASGALGDARLNAQVLRTAIRGVSNLQDEDGNEIDVELQDHPHPEMREHGQIATTKIVSVLDALDVRIVAELGERLIMRATRIAPKS